MIRKSLERRTPVGRVGKPADIAGLVSFMCGPDGEFMSGSYVIMDGGVRDARASGEPEPAVLQEMQRIMERGQERRAQLQTWIDQRD
jgi:hypothetical protein